MSNDLVPLLRHRQMEKTAIDFKGMYTNASNALAGRGINPLGAMTGTALGGVTGAVKGYKNADEDNKLKGALTGGIAGGLGGAILGHTMHQSVKNYQGLSPELKATKDAFQNKFKTKHEMGFLERLKNRFFAGEEGRAKLQQANERFKADKTVKMEALNKEKDFLNAEKMKIQTDPNLNYEQQLKKVDDLYSSNTAGRYEAANDKLKGAIFGPLAGMMTAGAISTAGETAFAPTDPNMVIQGLQAKKNLSGQDKFIINEKLKQIRSNQAGNGSMSGAM